MSTRWGRPTAWACAALLLGGCGGGGGGGESGDGPLADPAATTSSALIARRGRPAMFQFECSRHVPDVTTGDWEPRERHVRFERWIYPDDGGADVIGLVNGEIIHRSRTPADYSDYPSPDIDPRLFGCSEPMETVERVLDATRFSSTTGTEAEALLNLDGTRLEYTYYTVNGSVTGVQVGYANGALISMVTL